MTLRSYLIAIPIVAALSVGIFIGGGWAFSASLEHVFGQDTEQ